ncbi:Uncharacterised protein [Legionella pneumophila]|nr:Uncharacterised protein [Legionella pneumophila]
MAVIFAVLAKRASVAILQAGMRYSGNSTLMLRADSTRFNACTRAVLLMLTGPLRSLSSNDRCSSSSTTKRSFSFSCCDALKFLINIRHKRDSILERISATKRSRTVIPGNNILLVDSQPTA